MPCVRDDLPVNHFHVHLAVYLDGRPLTIPAGLGVGRPWEVNPPGFIATGGRFAWIHTHDTTGVVHVFTQVGKSDTLGQVFSVWGSLSRPTAPWVSGDWSPCWSTGSRSMATSGRSR